MPHELAVGWSVNVIDGPTHGLIGGRELVDHLRLRHGWAVYVDPAEIDLPAIHREIHAIEHRGAQIREDME